MPQDLNSILEQTLWKGRADSYNLSSAGRNGPLCSDSHCSRLDLELGFPYSVSRFFCRLQSYPILSLIFRMISSGYNSFQLKMSRVDKKLPPPGSPGCGCPACGVPVLPGLQDSGLKLGKQQSASGCQEGEGGGLLLASGLVSVEPSKSCPRGLAGRRELVVFLFKQTQAVC